MAGTVHALFTKPAKGAPMAPSTALTLVAGQGVERDANADVRSTRHVLLVGREAAAAIGAAPGSLRENITVEGIGVDGLASGTTLRLGGAELRVTYPCDPCGLLRRYSGIPPAVARGHRGMLAVVVQSATVAVGDAVEDGGVRYTRLPRTWRERLVWFLERLPAGRVLTYGDLTRAVGEPASVARVLPRILSQPAYASLPVDRVVGEGEVGPSQRWAYWDAVYEHDEVAHV